MTRKRKYVNFNDSEIDELLEKINKSLSLIKSGDFEDYVNKFFVFDKNIKNFSNERLEFLLKKIFNFIDNKKNKLRVRNDLKLNKETLFYSVFSDEKITKDDVFQIKLVFDFIDEKTELDEFQEREIDWYKEMYYDYLKENEKGINNSN